VSDDLLNHYNRELSYLRHLAGEFADAYPKIATRLRLDGGGLTQDPHVERLIEAFAYLNARTRLKLDDDFPEITDALLGALYPHYLAPVPSMTIAQLALDPGQAEMTSGYAVPAGALLETEPVQGEPCRFRTSYPVTLWPMEVRQASLSRPPFNAPKARVPDRAAAMLHLTVGCWSDAVQFADLTLRSLRFFLRGQPQHVGPLYELIFNNTLAIALARAPRDPEAVPLDLANLRPVGFGRDEGLLPFSARSFLGYRLLSEFFTFPTKFHFFDLAGLTPAALRGIGSQLEVFLFLDRAAPELERNVSADTFRLGCTPLVNLFRQRAEPIRLTQADWEYRVVPDARRPQATEVYSIDRVTSTSPDGEVEEYQPFFSTHHAEDLTQPRRYWHAVRRPAGEAAGRVDHGTEVYLSLVNLEMQPRAPADWTVDVETTCLNRDLPHQLPFGGGQPRLQLIEGGALVSRIECLTAPTPTLRPPRRHGAMWRLISHLTLNHLSITDQGQGAAALCEILKLYDFTDSPETRGMIEGVRNVSSRRQVARVSGEGGGGICRGVEVTLHLDPARFAGGLFLFASVVEHFLGLYASINSFTRLVVTVQGREGVLKRWPPRAGEKVIL
jgi:type VI secretion system protein ImpG